MVVTPRGVRRAGGDEAGEGPCFRDALFQDLTLRRLCVAEQQVVVDRLVLLALRGVDLQRGEQRIHAERAAFVGDDGYHQLADVLVAAQVAQQAGEAHGGAHLLLARPTSELLEGGVERHSQTLRGRTSRLGTLPPSARRRSIMYWYSTESSAGRK